MWGICVSFLLNEFLPTLGLKSVDNGMGLIVFGAEEKVVDYAVLAQDQVAALPRQVDRFFIQHKDIIKKSISQFVWQCFASLLFFK